MPIKAATTYYKVNDVVKFGGTQYKCTTAHTRLFYRRFRSVQTLQHLLKVKSG